MRHAPNNAGDELPPSSLRGRLCEVFFSAVLTEMIDPLMHRLGDKAELDDPIFGAVAGLEPMRTRLGEWTRFLAERDATYDRTITIVGADRDVTEGTLEVRVDGQHKSIPIAVLMERRREREVALRVYCATGALGAKAKGPSHGAPPETTGTIPIVAADFLAAIGRRDAPAISACFEQESSVRDAMGAELTRDAAARILASPLVVHGVADNGQVCALEVALGNGSRLGLLVLARGDSGLIRSLRIYSETS
jgi:hypothetical protein